MSATRERKINSPVKMESSNGTTEAKICRPTYFNRRHPCLKIRHVKEKQDRI